MKIELVVPAAPDGAQMRALSARVNNLSGKVVGLWYNDWSNYYVFVSRLNQLLTEQGTVSAVKKISDLPRRGSLAPSDLDALANQVDTAIVGLGA